MRKLLLFVAFLAAGSVAAIWAAERGWGPLVITREGEQKLILRVGEPRKVTSPGITWRIPIPFIERVRVYDSRLLYLNVEPANIQMRDGERIVVDNYAVWRIVDPKSFYAAFPTGMHDAETRIDHVVRGRVREVIGRHILIEVLTEKRLEIMNAITEQANLSLSASGVEIVDVRINRTEPPESAAKNVYGRMQAERERLARKYRAEGEERARRIRAEANREATITVAHARRDAEKLRGEGDAEATRIYADAYNDAPEFFEFRRSLEAYRNTIDENTTLVLSPNAEFFQFFDSADGANGKP